MTDDNSINLEDQSEGPQYALNQNILDLIQDNAKVLIAEYPNESLASILYTLVLTIIRSPQVRRTNGSMVPEIMVYYLTSYKNIILSQDENHPDPEGLINEAGLTLMDLYVDDPHNSTKRKLVEYIASSVREHWIDLVVKDERIEGVDEFTIVNNLTLISNTIPFYTARPRRDRNLTYIKWVRTVFAQLFKDKDPQFLKDAPDVIGVTSQIMKKQKVIAVSVH